MKITDIKQQVKRADRYSIYGDNKYVFSLSENELFNLGLKIGQEFDDDELENLHRKALLDKAYDRCLNLISRRPRSQWEIQQYLKQKQYSADVIEEIIGLLGDKNYLNDLKFANSWVNSRRLLKSVSKRRLTQELRAKRVADEIIKQALDADEASDEEVIKELITKKRAQTRYQDDQKLTAYLIRQGFNYSEIKQALN